ncbi:nucleoside deaminase [Methylacidimicrobium sp. B4]|uniref:nucleoside deaminase n=1 Tax=Methylacidimicrobium sp. B4 TaxID=2796139 RepID=UPI001A8BF8E9|nr:nucleoside deaminase [Methylacidimicrobium sp. B4]QSR84348.1 nucleoside deaminase [Methylacidimicrobium sp. B4]
MNPSPSDPSGGGRARGSASEIRFLEEAARLATENVLRNEGGPFGAVVVRESAIVGRGVNRVTARPDPTAHAEIEAIREAAQTIGRFDLGGCVLYVNCDPCPMCLAAAYWARIERIVCGAPSSLAAEAGFLDVALWKEVQLPPEERRLLVERIDLPACRQAFALWNQSKNKIHY